MTNKPIKVYAGDERLKDVYPFATKREMIDFKFRKHGIDFAISFVLISCFGFVGFMGYELAPKAVFANVSETVYVEVTKENKTPILERIAKCESGNTHFDKNGQVLMRSNTNKTVDVGRFQINSVWFKKATELGLDITKEKDNELMAQWIFKNRGTEDWYPSKKCWSK